MAESTGTPQRILDIAEHLVQTRGFNGFSYAHIAEAMHVTKASLHYHFPAKSDLGRRLIERYEEKFLAALARIDRQADDPREKLRRYVAIYAGVVRENRMCLCGMLAAEYGTLPEAMREEMRHFFDENERWLAGVLKAGRRSGVLAFKGSPSEAARALLGSLEGAMMIARSYAQPARFDSVSKGLLAGLGA